MQNNTPIKKEFFLKRLLKPALLPPPITNKKTIDKQYRYWRIRILYSTYIGYAVFYLTRSRIFGLSQI
jgi:OPA family sugar phosphate sensor protein UhpC-like MFS transporter